MGFEVGALAVDFVASREVAVVDFFPRRRRSTHAGCGRRRRHDRFVRGSAHLRPNAAYGPRGSRTHRLLRYPRQVRQYPGDHILGRVVEVRFLLVGHAVTAIRRTQRQRTAPIRVRVRIARSSVGHRHEAFGGQTHIYVQVPRQIHRHCDAGSQTARNRRTMPKGANSHVAA